MQSNQTMKGIDFKATKGPDGKYIIFFIRSQWDQMQLNLKMFYTQSIMQQINVQQVAGKLVWNIKYQKLVMTKPQQ